MRDRILAYIRRRIVLAAPTCTLWVEGLDIDGYRFLLNPRWTISKLEIDRAQAQA